MRHTLLAVLVICLAGFAYAQSGPCTTDVIDHGKIQLSDDAFMYMTPFGKPVIGKGTIHETAGQKFGKRTNVKRAWEKDHRIVVSPAGDMGYEAGTMAMSYDEDQKTVSFKAVILNVYKAKNGACEQVAGTMEPLEEADRK